MRVKNEWKIGKLTISGRCGLSPMAAYTTLPFRLLCHQYGAAWSVTELVSTKAIVKNLNTATKQLIRTCGAEKPVGLQLFGSEAADFAKSVELVGSDFDFIDINCGCSVPKILKQESGAFLIKHPEKLEKIIGAILKETDKPVTVKIRSGFDQKVNAVEVAQMAQNSGAAAITLHPRLASQGFSGQANWDLIRQVKEGVDIPVIGNGDVKTGQDAFKMKEQTGCDGVLIGRGALGNAFIFKQIRAGEQGEMRGKATDQNRLQEWLDFSQLEKKYPIAPGDFKAMALAYTRGLAGATQLRDQLSKSKTKEEIQSLVVSGLTPL